MLHNERGTALGLVLMCVIIFSFLGMGLLEFGSANTRDVEHGYLWQRTFWTAEAGLDVAASRLVNNDTFRDNPTTFSDVQLSSAMATVTFTPVAGSTTKFIVQSTGTENQRATVVQEEFDVVPEQFSNGIYMGNNVSLSNAQGDNIIDGDIAVGGKVSGEEDWEINGVIQEDYDINFPYMAFDEYLAVADYVEEGNFTFEAGQTYEGMYYIKGTADVEANVVINGSIISEGGVNMRGSNGTVIDSGDSYIAVMTKGNLLVSDSSGMAVYGNGLMYAEGKVNFQNIVNCTFETILVGAGNLSVNNTEGMHIEFNADVMEHFDEFFLEDEDNIKHIIKTSNWQEVSRS